MRHKTPADTAAAVGASEPLIVLCRSLADATLVVGDTGIELVTSFVSGKRATAAPIALNIMMLCEVRTGFEPAYTALQAAA